MPALAPVSSGLRCWKLLPEYNIHQCLCLGGGGGGGGDSEKVNLRRRDIVERVSQEEVVVDYANDIDTAKCAPGPVARLINYSSVSKLTCLLYGLQLISLKRELWQRSNENILGYLWHCNSLSGFTAALPII